MFNNADEVYAFLNRFLNMERRADPKAYRLDRMLRLKELFNNPDEAFRIFHIAGSKGKGSTATMLASILNASGRKTGLFTSPHLLHYTERINIDGQPVSDSILLPAASELAKGLEGQSPADYPGGEAPTYFELLTMLAFLCFKRYGCEDLVLEVGLGGRLDSTNVVKPYLCIITEIELEHTELLGNTIAQIAKEKAGIIKPSVPVFISASKPEALEVFKAKAEETESRLYILDNEYKLSDVEVNKYGTGFSIKKLHAEEAEMRFKIGLIGQVQARNASIALMSALYAGCSLEQIRQGLSKANLRARFEIINKEATIILDGAHTIDSIKASMEDFNTLFPEGGQVLFACAKDKDVKTIATILKPNFSEAIITKPGTFKESDISAMATAFKHAGIDATVIENTEEAIKTAINKAEKTKKPLLIIGSFYLCAIAAELLK